MRRCAFRWFCATAWSLLLSIPLSGQATVERTSPADASRAETHLGYPQDWSSRHLLMPGMRAEDVLAAGDRDPRYVYNMVMRQVAEGKSRLPVRLPVHPIRRPTVEIDWAGS